VQRLIEFAGNHPYLVSAAVALLVAAIVAEMRARIQDFAAISPAEAIRLMNRGAALIDVRSPSDYEAGHISDARNIPLSELAASANALKKYREKPIITCDETGMAGGLAARELRKLGFAQVMNLRGGLAAWRKEGLPLVSGGRKAGEKPAARA
jgi:rhodanese-related sulfurtransferase